MKSKLSPRVEAAMIQNISTLRREIANLLDSSKRNLNKECGYPDKLSHADYKAIYDREGIGTRVVDIFPRESWKHDPEVMEDSAGEESPWEKRFKEIEEEFNIFHELMTADITSGIGSYGIVLLGIDDGKKLSEPVDGVDPTGNKRLSGGVTRNLTFIRSFDNSVTSIKAVEKDPKSPRYGLPIMYSVNMATCSQATLVPDAAMSIQEFEAVDIHWHRVIHIAENLENSRVYAVPRLQSVFNRMLDLRKLCGGAGEMFYKGGFPGLSLEAQPDAAAATLSETGKKALREEYADYENGLSRAIFLQGMTAKSLAVQVADPLSHFDLFCKFTAMTKGIPYRIFMGSEEAKLASGEDKTAWNESITMRRKKYVIPRIIRPVVRRMVAVGIIEEPKKLICTFPSLFTPNRKDQAEIATKLTDALIKYIQANADVLIQPLEFLTEIIGLDTELAQSICDKALLADDGTLDDEEEPTELDNEEKRAGIELTRAKAKQALRPPPKKGLTRNDADEEARRTLFRSKMRLRLRLNGVNKDTAEKLLDELTQLGCFGELVDMVDGIEVAA